MGKKMDKETFVNTILADPIFRDTSKWVNVRKIAEEVYEELRAEELHAKE